MNHMQRRMLAEEAYIRSTAKFLKRLTVAIAVLLVAYAAVAIAFGGTAHAATSKAPSTSRCTVIAKTATIECTLVNPTGLKVNGAVQKSLSTKSPLVKGRHGVLTIAVKCDGGLSVLVHKTVRGTAVFGTAEIHPALPEILHSAHRCRIEITGRLLKKPAGKPASLNYGVVPNPKPA